MQIIVYISEDTVVSNSNTLSEREVRSRPAFHFKICVLAPLVVVVGIVSPVPLLIVWSEKKQKASASTQLQVTKPHLFLRMRLHLR